MGKSVVRISQGVRSEDFMRIGNACTMGPVTRTSIPGLFVATVEGERVPDAPQVVAINDGGRITFQPYEPA